MIPLEAAQTFAEAWIEAWNAHDLDAIMEHYAEKIEFTSPLIIKRLDDPTGKIHDKTRLKDYFARGLAHSDLHFTLLQVLPGVGSVTIYYRRHDGVEVAEMMV